MFRVIDEIAPVAVLHRPAAGKDRRHAGGTVAEDRFQPPTVGRKSLREWVVLYDLPPAGVDKNKQWQDSFHFDSGVPFVISACRQPSASTPLRGMISKM